MCVSRIPRARFWANASSRIASNRACAVVAHGFPVLQTRRTTIMVCSTRETAMAARTRMPTETEEHIALKRNRLVLEQARAVGLLGEAKNTRLSGRVPA